MSKLSCNVIRDLIPAYVDEICSEDTRTVVEQHMQDCDGCKRLVEMMKNTEIVAVESDRKQIDYMKKIKRYLTGKNIICIGLLLLAAGIGMLISIRNYGMVPLSFYYGLMPVWMAVAYLTISDYSRVPLGTKRKRVLPAVSGVLFLYSILLEFLAVNWLKSGSNPFHMEAERIGVWLHNQLLLLTALQLAGFFTAWIISMRTGNSHIIMMNLSILGCCVALGFLSILRPLFKLEYLVRIRNESLLIFLMEGVVCTAIALLLSRRKDKKIAFIAS